MSAVATGSQEINWQEKYLQQIDARLKALQDGQNSLDARIERLAQKLDAKIDERFAHLDTKIDEDFARLDSKTDESLRRLDAKIDNGLREVRRLQWGTLALLGATILGSLLRGLS